MMADITILNDEATLAKYTPDNPMKIADPACGSGIMLLAAASVLPPEFLRAGRAVFFGCDLDQTCVQMARLNCLIYGLGGGQLEPVKNTAELTPNEIATFPEPHKSMIQATLFELEKNADG